MVVSTVSRSSVEFTAWLTSPSARQLLDRFGEFPVRACTSSNSRTFSMAITAWSAKVLSSSICLSVNGPVSRAQMTIVADQPARRGSCGTPRQARKPAALWLPRFDTRESARTSGIWTAAPVEHRSAGDVAWLGVIG